MTKQELMETYTAEQLAEMVVRLDIAGEMSAKHIRNLENEIIEKQSEIDKYRKAFEEGKEKHERHVVAYQKEVKELKQKLERQETATKYAEEYVDSLKCSVDRKQDAINQIDGIICELFGIAHNEDIYSDDFKELLRKKSEAGKTITDFIPTEPIKVVDILINAHKRDLYEDSAYYSKIYRISELRQIAEHLLVYCNHNGEVEE